MRDHPAESEIEESFFRRGDQELWDDLEEEHEPAGFMARLFGARPTVKLSVRHDDEDEWERQLALARARLD